MDGKVKLWSSRIQGLVSEKAKERAFKEFFSKETLFIYCDCSMKKDNSTMSIASTYVYNQSIVITQKEVVPPNDCINKTVYGEIHSIIFALTLFGGFVEKECTDVFIYSDVNNIEEIIKELITFKKSNTLRKLQSELILCYKEAQKQHPDLKLKINYLPKHERKQNPFSQRSHNAAKRMLTQ